MERRLVAILAADVVGYSRKLADDEEGTIRAMRALHATAASLVATEHGRIIDTAGDSILAEFPSVLAAVRCATALHGAIEAVALQLRIGLHQGEIAVDGERIYGDGINIASRLQALADPGGTVISGRVHEDVSSKVALAWRSGGDHVLKNIATPVRVYHLAADGADPPGALELPDRPSIAVLPFQNMSGDADQEYFAEGMVEDIITGLSRIRWLFVIARNSSAAYKAKAVDVRRVGRELGVRYLVEGSVRRLGDRLRVTAQLIEAGTGSHLWAERYDGSLQDVFDFQDSITERVVGIIEPSVRKSEIERSRRKRPDSLDAYDLFLRAMPDLQARMPDGGRAAIPLLENALSLDPGYHAARAHLAWCHEWCFTRGGLDEAHRSAALYHARAALSSDTDDAAALAIAGWVVIVLTKEHDMAKIAIERALSINPSCATAHYFAALVSAFAGARDATRQHAERALRLSPFDPSAFEAHLALGIAELSEASFETAASHFATAARVNPRHSLFPFLHAISLALAGRAEDATNLVQRGLEMEPTFRIQIFSEFGMAPALADLCIKGARLLSLPE